MKACIVTYVPQAYLEPFENDHRGVKETRASNKPVILSEENSNENKVKGYVLEKAPTLYQKKFTMIS